MSTDEGRNTIVLSFTELMQAREGLLELLALKLSVKTILRFRHLAVAIAEELSIYAATRNDILKATAIHTPDGRLVPSATHAAMFATPELSEEARTKLQELNTSCTTKWPCVVWGDLACLFPAEDLDTAIVPENFGISLIKLGKLYQE